MASIDVILISRSRSLNKISRIDLEGNSFTGLEVIQKDPQGWHRADIALVNVTQDVASKHCKTCSCESVSEFGQYAVFVDAGGNLVGDGIKYLNGEQLVWCVEEANKLIELVETIPEVAVYLRGC